jgi:ribose transport system ATP-binding protein
MSLSQSPATADEALAMVGVTKTFPGVRALEDVSFSVRAGEVHALIGENGAGKSTLLKILSGVYRADAGEIRLAGQPYSALSPKAARQAGIAMIHQELQQIPRLDVAQNMFLGTAITRLGLFTDKARMREKAREVLALLDPTIDVASPLGKLRVAQRQIVEIAKALLSWARVIAMDEPTSSLTPREFERLVSVIESLQARNVAVIYVSHKLEEVFRVATRATVLRDGRKVGAVDLSTVSEDQLVAMMVGRSLVAHSQRSFARDEIVLEARGLGRGDVVKNVDFALRRGEVLGIAGLVGAGRTELARLVAGVDTPTAGTIRVRGQAVALKSPRDAIARGVALLPEERKKDGILPLRDTLTQSVSLRPPDIGRAAKLFSGGNQQKAIICRWLMAEAEVLIFDEPTRGIDVGAKVEIHRLIEGLAEQGCSIIVVSSELPEILRLADRVLVMRRGASEGVLPHDELTEESIMHLAVTGAQNQGQSRHERGTQFSRGGCCVD